MEKILDILEKISNSLSSILFDIAKFAMVVWPIIMVAYIVLRYFGINWLFVEEYTGYWQILIVYFSLTYTLKLNKHIFIDALINKLTEKARSTIQLITSFLTFFVTLYLLGKSIEFVRFGLMSQAKSFTTNSILWPIYLLIPIGLISINIELFIQLYKKMNNYFFKKSL